MVSPHGIDTKNPTAVADAVGEIFAASGGDGSRSLIRRGVKDITRIFQGGYAGFQATDMEYHDLDHTLQVTVCMAHLLKGRKDSTAIPQLSARDWELAVFSALLHDTGFLKETGDNSGTGAKYTFVHERRSCAFARIYLPELGFSEPEIEDVCSAMMCTGPRNSISNVSFRREEARQIALLLVTADYLAQMSASDYLEKLPLLYLEFVEAFESEGVPLEKRPYQTLDQLLEMTPGFWEKFVLPLLEGDAEGAFRYLAPPGGTNPYIKAIEKNLAELERRLKVGAA